MPSDEPAEVAASHDTAELDAIRTAIIDAASVSGGLWVSYLGLLFYLLIAIGSVTDRDLFLETSIKLPVLFVDLPTRGFALIAPVLFLIGHAYLLLHFAILSDKIVSYNKKLAVIQSDQISQSDFRRLLPTNIFVLFLAGPTGVRDGVTGLFLRIIALFTMVFCPIALLWFVEVQFLPYHSHIVTWTHRCVVAADLGLLWVFWPRITLRNVTPSWRPQRTANSRSVSALAAASPFFLLCVATFPGEVMDPLANWIPGRNYIVSGNISNKTLHVAAVFSNILDVPKFDAIGQAKIDGEAKLAAALRTIVVEGRDFRKINLKLADLRKAELFFSDLTDAELGTADLSGAKLFGAVLPGADLGNAKLIDANLTGTDLAGAKFERAVLTRTDLGSARLVGADLTNADLNGARFDGADLTGAKISSQAQLDRACGTTTKLPAGYTLKPCPVNWPSSYR